MGAFQEYVGTCSTTGDVLLPDSLAFGNNDEPMKTFATAGAVMLFAPIWGQNLVPNGSFEEFTECPQATGYWATDWTGPYGSPDFFHRCAPGDVCSVPFNNMGYQEPAQGDGYMGFATYLHGCPLCREVIAAELTEPLQVGFMGGQFSSMEGQRTGDPILQCPA